MLNWAWIKENLDTKAKLLITLGTCIGMLVSALVWWNNSGLPRLAWNSEVAYVHANSLQTQADFYIRAKRSDERVLFDLDNEIDKFKQQNKTVPETALQQRMRIQEDIDHSKQRLNDAKAKMKQQQ
jgi:hypothetical protein